MIGIKGLADGKGTKPADRDKPRSADAKGKKPANGEETKLVDERD